MEAVDWNSFYVRGVPSLVTSCFRAFDLHQRIAFSDQAPVQASYNDIDRSNPTMSVMNVGVGNLQLYPFTTLVAVILHELGHYFCFRSPEWDMIESYSVHKQIELLADFVAGAAYARMEPSQAQITEIVRGQCNELERPSNEDKLRHRAARAKVQPHSAKISLNAKQLARVNGKADFFVLRDWRVEPLANNALIGTMPTENRSENKCSTEHRRTIDFLSMAAAVSSWRTFGDRPATESHGTPAERYDAFSLGYEIAMGDQHHVPRVLAKSLVEGINYLKIGR
jgi:hypothetical protein